MKLVKTDSLKGGEILGKPILAEDLKILLSEGTVLRSDYIKRIEDMGVTEIYIKDMDQAKYQEVVLLKSEIEEEFKSKIRNIFDKHNYDNNEELSELVGTSEDIINSILKEDEVVDKIYDIKERSADIYEHSINLCSLATLTALKLKISEKEVKQIGIGCLLHDLGLKYLKIPYEDQDISLLSKAELMEYMKHPVYGYSIVKDETWLSNIAKSIVLYHHEYLDGSGYPLHAKEIPFEVAIVSVCDVFDEMICGIGCSRVKVYEAIEYLRAYKNIRYYPKIVDTLLEFTAVYPAGSMVILSDGSQGKVVRQNKEFPDRPIILLSKDSKGNIIPRGREIDLVKVNNVFIEKELI